uniref:Lateral tail fiber protein n=1 Tax=Escherichia phage ETEP102 TaxID=3117680 RepID=A0AAU6PXX7_9CAUD
MAIYDLGTASLAANGEVTGVGTTWKAPLTLIRVGATIVFKTEPVQIYTISEIISDTQINVYNPNSETVPAGTGYAILAHDGITVQGLAQDVAETLRYYQSRETEVADAVDAFNNFDANDFSAKVAQVNTQHGDIVSIGLQVSTDASKVSADKDAASASALAAESSKNSAATSAQEAEYYAASLDTSILLRKDLALSDLTDKPLARLNLNVYSKIETLNFKNIYPTMTNQEIRAILLSGGDIFVNSGQYYVASATQTWALAQNTRLYWSAGALLSASSNNVTLLRMSSEDVSSAFIRNCKVYNPRLSTVGFNNCIGLHAFNARNNSGVDGLWLDLGLGSSNNGVIIEKFSYGFRFNDSEILNGGVGSIRVLLRNGPNSVLINNHIGYSGDHSGALPDYGIVIFNGSDGSFNFPEGSDLWPTAATVINGGYSQNTSKYGILDSGVSTLVNGTYLERNGVSDVALSSGSYYFTSNATHHSLNVGESCFKGSGANHATIGAFNPADRSIGLYNFASGVNCRADGSKIWGGFLNKIGVVGGLILDLGNNSLKQYSSSSLPINTREGYSSYRINVTSGLDVTTTTPRDGECINLILRGANIQSLSFNGISLDVTGANTSTTKTCLITAIYWSEISTYIINQSTWR